MFRLKNVIYQVTFCYNFIFKNYFEGCSIELFSTITRENLRVLLNSFYQKTLDDALLGPYFIHELGDDITDHEWVEHIELLADFWLMQMVGEDTYFGNFVGAHVKMPFITKESLAQWVKLFSQTLDEMYEPQLSETFKNKSIALSREFMTSKKKI